MDECKSNDWRDAGYGGFFVGRAKSCRPSSLLNHAEFRAYSMVTRASSWRSSDAALSAAGQPSGSGATLVGAEQLPVLAR